MDMKTNLCGQLFIRLNFNLSRRISTRIWWIATCSPRRSQCYSVASNKVSGRMSSWCQCQKGKLQCCKNIPSTWSRGYGTGFRSKTMSSVYNRRQIHIIIDDKLLAQFRIGSPNILWEDFKSCHQYSHSLA